jgi:CRISPR-associated endonuclease/helicase Cas3
MLYGKVYYREGKRYPQSLKEHTAELLKGIPVLKKYYSSLIEERAGGRVWELLFLSALFHDLGKASDHFQARIKRALGEKIRSPKTKEIPHNFLSAACISRKLLKELYPNLTRTERFTLYDILFYSVAFHHKRELLVIKEEEFKKSFSEGFAGKEELLNDFIKELCREFGEEELCRKLKIYEFKPETAYKYAGEFLKLSKKGFKELSLKFGEGKNLLIFVKGLLHRLDHSASAGVVVEEKPHEKRIDTLENHLKEKQKSKFIGFRPFQLRARSYSEDSVILIAPTGSGKTEFAVNWLKDSKGFYTLPVKTAVNAMHQRLKRVFKTVGLLHGERALYYALAQKEAEVESLGDRLLTMHMTSQLSMPLTVSTADQLFTAAFKYPGFEKIYATLAYSKTVIDEPQAYSPETLAPIVKLIEEVSELGGKFCVMSATLFPFLREKLEEFNFKLVDTRELYENAEVKHKISLEGNFQEALDKVLKNFESGRSLLIIVNTVRKAQELYLSLKKQNLPVNLLHSLYILKQRKVCEAKIKRDSDKKRPVIWITTQVAEASLDIDFDLLLTEASTLDSLIQRMGRVFRRAGRKDPEEPNVLIVEESSDRGKVYDKKLVELAVEGLEEFDKKFLRETDKKRLVEELYTRENLEKEAKSYIEKFSRYMNMLELGIEASSRSEAQKLFREILNLSVIPENIFYENEEKVKKLLETSDDRSKPLDQRLRAEAELKSYTVSVPVFRLKNKGIIELDKRRKVLVASGLNYDKELGIPLVEMSREEAEEFDGVGREFI